MRRTILLICALMLASCDQGPPPSTPVVKGERGDKGDKGETGDKGEQRRQRRTCRFKFYDLSSRACGPKGLRSRMQHSLQ